MKTSLKTLALVAAFSTALASAAVSPARAGMSTQDWYHHIETMRKKGQDHPWVAATIKAIKAPSVEMTIAHDAILHVKMPAMTMTFPVRDAADLTAHKVGDRVSVQVGEDGGVIKIVHITSGKR